MAGLAAEAPAAVAVLDFSVPAAEGNRWTWTESGMADLLQIELQQQGLLLLDRDAIHAVLNEQRLAVSGQTAKDYLTVAKLLNAQFLITGRVVPLDGGRFRVEAGAFSVEAVETEATATSEGDFPKELSRVLKDAAKQIATKLPTRNGFTGETEQTIRAPKPESLIMFYHGLNACASANPESGAAYFMNAAALDPDFTVPLLWEIKAYEMAGLPQHAAIRRNELADILKPLGMAGATNISEISTRPVLAVLNPVVNAAGFDGASIAGDLKRTLLAENQVRVFAFEGIGAAVAEQDLRLSSFFASQDASRYGRWLTVDALLLCQVNPSERGAAQIELSLVNPMNASVMARNQRTMSLAELPAQIPGALKELVGDWLKHPKENSALPVTAESPAVKAKDQNSDLRPVYQGLLNALTQLRREPNKSDSHRALADAFASVGRPRLAAYEIEQCLKLLDIHAPGADGIYLGTHRWLFWEPSPASGAAGLVDRKLIDQMIEQLLTTYPKTLAAGCMRYNLAVTAWRGKNWPEAISQAQQAREILQSLIANYDRKATGVNRGDEELEMAAATYFLEGSSLRETGGREEAEKVFHLGLDFMQSNDVRDFCLPYGPYLGNFFGPQRVYGYGGDAPGIKTRLEQQLAELESVVKQPPVALKEAAETREPAVNTNSSAYWLKLGEVELHAGNYRQAVAWYQRAVANGASVWQCPGLSSALLEIALNQNLDHLREEIERLRRQLDFPPVEASWVDWFGTGRKYQTGRQFDWQKAAASYRGALDFLEHPEQGGIYHLEKQPDCDRVALRWGPTLGEWDLLWSEHYDARWYSAAFYLAQCLVKLDRKEEAAQWLRQIAIKVGGDSAVPLLDRDAWNGSGWSSGNLGARAAELLQELHQSADAPKAPEFGETDGPFKVPPAGLKAQPPSPPLPTVKPEVVQALTNLLAELARVPNSEARTARLQTLVANYGHEIVPATVSLLSADGDHWDEGALIWMLEQTATHTDAQWVAGACARHLNLIVFAQKLDPNATAAALAEEWREEEGSGNVSFWLKNAIVDDRVRPLYALVLRQIADAAPNHHTDVFHMDWAVSRENSAELETAFRQALSSCLKTKLLKQDHYELNRISQIALRRGVPEAIDGFLALDRNSPAQLRADLGGFLDLPEKDDEVVAFLKANNWKWNPGLKQFQPVGSRQTMTVK